MPVSTLNNGQEIRHIDDMQDIITKVPSWLLRWGISLFFFILVLIIGLSAFIRYPDMVQANLKITSPNSPKPVVAKIQGKLVGLLVKQNDNVAAGQPLGYIESTADHAQVLNLLSKLLALQKEIQPNSNEMVSLLNKT
ncbi:MAG TPA: biotin/lipoyl-binding protein, partial [Mucilaginibacter sp.]|nr:biotin/lipoyl-binding protein [Mucilaginibacter sp.]